MKCLASTHRRRRLTALSFSIVLAIGCASTTHAQSQKWKFLVYGDSRGTNSSNNQINTVILSELARVTTNEQPAFVLVPGDLVNAGNMSAFQSWSNILSPVYQAGIGVYPVLGNHDDDSDPSAFTNFFKSTIPDNGPAGEIDRTYFIAYSNVLVLAIDNYVNPNGVNTNWVKSVLATNTRPHVFAFGHQPAFKANHTDCLDDHAASRNVFWNSLSNANSRIYFAGHDHFYNHLRAEDGDGNTNNDVHQMIVGTAGAPLTSTYAYNGVNGGWTPRLVFHENQYGYVVVEVEGYGVTTTWYHRTGVNAYAATSEVFSYSVAPPRPVIAFGYSDGGLTLTWPGGGTLQAAPEVAGVYTNVAGATSPFVITNLDQPSLYYRVSLP